MTIHTPGPGVLLESILAEVIDDRFKGMPGNLQPTAIGNIHQHGWNVLREDLPLPLAVLRQSALDHNVAWMRRFTESSGVKLCPHGKTTMSPQLFSLQLNAGAWGITAATIGQVQVYRRFGVPRILLANQLVGPAAITYVLSEIERDPNFDFYCLVDSVGSVELLERQARRAQIARPLQVLLETGEPGGRAGARTIGDRLATANAVAKASPVLALRGVEGFEGVVQTTAEATNVEEVTRIVTSVAATAEILDHQNMFAAGPVLLSAGGSGFFDVAAAALSRARIARERIVVLRSGCYIVHDSDWCDSFFRHVTQRDGIAQELGEGLRPALELWAYVQSRPERGKAIATFGKRDASYDAGFPIAIQWFRPGKHVRPQPLSRDVKVVKMNDQHAYLEVPDDSPFLVGDIICFGVSHPCTTFDKWQILPLVNDVYDVVGAIRTYF